VAVQKIESYFLSFDQYEDFWKTVCENLEKAFDELHGEITSELQLQL